MILPDKHTKPSLSVINVTGLILKELNDCQTLQYEELLNVLVKQTSEKVKEVFLYSLSLLFILGKIEYIGELDAIGLINENQ